MQEARRSFLKKAAVAGAITTAGAVAASGKQAYNSSGVVVGKSPKKEILYKKTQAWELFYKTAL